jgi:hypothetical protein
VRNTKKYLVEPVQVHLGKILLTGLLGLSVTLKVIKKAFEKDSLPSTRVLGFHSANMHYCNFYSAFPSLNVYTIKL